MAGKLKSMSQVKQLLLLHKNGASIKRIARCTGMSKNTVRSYLRKLHALKAHIDELLLLDDPLLEKQFSDGNPAYKDGRFEQIKVLLPDYVVQLDKFKLTKKVLWEEYRQAYPDGYGYTQFCHHLNQYLKTRKPTMVLTHHPAEKLFVDFAGRKLSYVNPQTGEVIPCNVFVACLPFSDHSFVMAVHSQSVEDFIYALVNCLEYLGGSTQMLVTDNLKSAVIKADRYEPDLNRALEDCCNHYGIRLTPTRTFSPQDKAMVENQVKLIYARIFAPLRNRTFFSLSDLNKAIMQYNRRHNQTRMQQRPYCREENFLANEKPLLKPLPATRFELKYYAKYTVAKNNHILLTKDKHYYSVPYRYIGQKVEVIYTHDMVRIYPRDGGVIVHLRDRRAGKYSTIKEHLCSHHQHYLDRSPQYYMDKAQAVSTPLYELIRLLFAGGRCPEQNYRTCDGLFSLQRKTSSMIFDQACQQALSCQCYSYRFVRKLIDQYQKNNLQGEEPKALPQHSNIRGKDYYQQLSIDF